MIPIKQLINTAGKWTGKHAPEILTVIGGIGVVATGYFGVKNGMTLAYDLSDNDISNKEKAKTILKDTAPTIAVGTVTIAAIISSGVISKRRMKALAASYALLAESSETFKRKVIERMGDKKVDEVRGDIAKEEFEKDADKDIQITDTNGGSYLFKDGVTKQYFRSSADFVRKMQNKVNAFYTQGENFVTVSEWYGYLGLEAPADVVGELGWPAASGISFDLSSTICPNGEPGYYIYYNVEPMTQEEAELYDANHIVANVYE